MNRFELFCMIFYVLDAEWDETKDEELGNFLSEMNPFAFADIGSAEPSAYERFCQAVPETIKIEESYGIARNYIDSLGRDELENAFLNVDSKEWTECAKEYLSNPHKGQDIEHK